MTPDQLAFLRKIAGDPADELPRLVYADWLDENGACDRDAATAEFIRLSCGRPEPKRPKTVRCPACGNGLYSNPFGCNTCDGKGRVPNKPAAYRITPPAVRKWLKANWRRLVPLLTAEWDKFPAEDKVAERLVELEDVIGDIPLAAGPMSEAVRDAVLEHAKLVLSQKTWERWTSATFLRCGVPFTLPDYHGEGSRTYVPAVQLSFDRGFVSHAYWRAPRLGVEIGGRVRADQPLADLTGPQADSFLRHFVEADRG